jgi:DNA-binding response OmpR family regulator
MGMKRMDDKKTILMVEDAYDILWMNRHMFVTQGYTVITAKSLSETRARLNGCDPDVIILDIMLPDGNALDFIPEIRAKTNAPILLLTALTDRDDRLSGLRAGGDDYISKPYDIDELAARVEAFLRREDMHRKNPARELASGALRIDTVLLRAFVNGRDLLLQPKEFALLLFFMQNENQTLKAETLYKKVWQRPLNNDTNAVRYQISCLRKKLKGSGYVITAEYGEGYRFKSE